MLLDIQPDGPTPIYEQIMRGVVFAVAAGELEQGALIPSVRELAGRLIINPNTVARAYQELERAGVITARRGRGMEVAPEAAALCRSRRQAIVRERIRAALREAVASALPADELRTLVEDELSRANGQAGRRTGKGPQ
jgi:GntR family transcriptional regulator